LSFFFGAVKAENPDGGFEVRMTGGSQASSGNASFCSLMELL
jgi:hypothetical protein